VEGREGEGEDIKEGRGKREGREWKEGKRKGVYGAYF